MVEIDDYVQALYWRDLFQPADFPDAFVRKDELVSIFRVGLMRGLSAYQAQDATDLEYLSESIFGQVVDIGAMERKTDPFAGVYFRPTRPALLAFRTAFLNDNFIHRAATDIGPAFYGDVFAGFKGQNPLADSDLQAIIIPASDRLVTLGHNQAREFEEPLNDLVDQLERDNGIPELPGTRERLLGQVKAGRELLRAGTFKAYLLYATLIRALGELIERYAGTAIAMVAASLIDLLVKNALGAN